MPLGEGEVILNKKAVYEPTKGQRFRQIVCSRGWAMGILLLMGSVMVGVAVIAAFARPSAVASPAQCPTPAAGSASALDIEQSISVHESPQTYNATNGEPFPWKHLRLPKSLIPETYNIFLHANLTESYFTGHVRMVLRVEQETDFIIFHSKQLNISNVKVYQTHSINSTLSEEVTVQKELEYVKNAQYYLQLATKLQNSTFVQVNLDFRGSLADVNKLSGFYKSSYTINGQERFIASTHFEATAARQAFPCLDEPELKAKFTMSLVRDPKHITLFNMPLKRTAPYHNDLVVDEYEETVRMSTYLVAYVISDFKNISATTKAGVQVRVFASEDKVTMGQVALNAAVALLDYYSDFFGTPYPLPKQDLIAIPNFGAGAMENWGLITFRESSLLYDPNLSTASTRQGVVSTVAHELAHQWFGNLVTMKWWNDLWLNEGFASFVENDIGTDYVESNLRKKDLSLLSYLDAMADDSLVSSHPIAVTVNDPSEIDAAFDSISYDKGSAILYMLKNFLRDDIFKRGLSLYLQRHKFSNAETSDLWDALQEVSNLPAHLTVSKVMDTWTKQMGLPVVTVTIQDGKLHLSQKRFLLSGASTLSGSSTTSDSPFGYKWVIPFTYTTSSDLGKQNLVWLSDEQAELALNDTSFTWLKANVETQGFYRVNYDNNGWQAIIRQLVIDHTVFTVADRVGLIDDAFYLARAGLLDYETALDLTEYLANETEYFIWDSVLSHFNFLKARLFLEEEYDHLNDYILRLTKTLVDATAWSKQTNPVDEYMQSLMIGTAANLEYQNVTQKAVAIFGQWKENLPITISNGLRSTVYSNGVKYGTKADWEFVLHRYITEVVPSERRNLLRSLTYSRDARLLQMLLKYSLDDSKVKSQDSDSVLSGVSGSKTGQLFAWKFIRENYNTLLSRFGSSSFLMSDIIKSAVSAYNTQFDYDEVSAFFKNKELGTGKLALEQSLEYIQSHIDWTKNYMPTVKSWLQKLLKV